MKNDHKEPIKDISRWSMMNIFVMWSAAIIVTATILSVFM